jgi:hypothetical protein
MSKQNKQSFIESAKIHLPLEYWDQRKQFLKEVRRWFIFGKVRMIKGKDCCHIVFYNNTSLYYLVNAAIHFGAFLKSNGYKTYHNAFLFNEEKNNSK